MICKYLDSQEQKAFEVYKRKLDVLKAGDIHDEWQIGGILS